MRPPAARSAVIAAEPLERRRTLAVQVIAPIDPVAMSIGSAGESNDVSSSSSKLDLSI